MEIKITCSYAKNKNKNILYKHDIYHALKTRTKVNQKNEQTADKVCHKVDAHYSKGFQIPILKFQTLTSVIIMYSCSLGTDGMIIRILE